MRAYVVGGIGVFALVVVLAISYSCPGTLQTWGLDVWNLPALTQRLNDATTARTDLELRDKAVLRRIAIKEEIIADVIANRLPLVEAAALFQELNTSCPEYMVTLRLRHPQLSEEEISCRNVIDFVSATLSTNPSRAGDTVSRLENELRTLLHREGVVKLKRPE